MLYSMRSLIALLSAGILSCQAGLSDLEALSLIESGGNDAAVGEAGEVSRYQILPKVWRTYSRSQNYRNPWLSGEVARHHLRFLMTRFQQETGRNPRDFDLYVMWNAGLTYYRKLGFDANKVHRIIRERAERFVNLKQYLPATPSLVQASVR
jgi:hypothetical protein